MAQVSILGDVALGRKGALAMVCSTKTRQGVKAVPASRFRWIG